MIAGDVGDADPVYMHSHQVLSSDDVFQETSSRYRAVEPEQWLQRHPEAGSSWPSWPKASRNCNCKGQLDGPSDGQAVNRL